MKQILSLFLFAWLFTQAAIAESGSYIMVREFNFMKNEIRVIRLNPQGDYEGYYADGKYGDALVWNFEPKHSPDPTFKLLEYYKGTGLDARQAFADAVAAAAQVSQVEATIQEFHAELTTLMREREGTIQRASLVQWDEQIVKVTPLGKPPDSTLKLFAAAKSQTRTIQPGCWVMVQPLQVFSTTNSGEVKILKNAGRMESLEAEKSFEQFMPHGNISNPKTLTQANRVPIAVLQVFKPNDKGVIMGGYR